jgi:tRNA(Arg) A34 adenosine deaminase TadA
METSMTEQRQLSALESDYLARAVALAASARDHGNHPFGALLVTAAGEVVEAENTVVTGNDPTGHAETNLVRAAASTLTQLELDSSTLYTSTEPCAMCSGAIYWAGIPRVVFDLSETALASLTAGNPDHPTLALPSRELFARGSREVDAWGPLGSPAAVAVHEGFWS